MLTNVKIGINYEDNFLLFKVHVLIDFLRYKTVVNQRKVGRTILQKTRCNVEDGINEYERCQNDVTASVSADHDYNGQNSRTNGNI